MMLKITGRCGLSVSDTNKENMATEGRVSRSDSNYAGFIQEIILTAIILKKKRPKRAPDF